MRIVKRNEKAATRAPSRKVARVATAKSATMTGLTGFAIDVSEPVGRKAFAALTQNRGSFQGFAAGAAANVKKLDPETAARTYLNQALESDAVKKFARPAIETGTSDFQSLGTETVPLTGTTIVKFRQTFNKIPVYGSLVTVELDKGNECLAISSSLGTPKGVRHVATVSPVEALKVAAKESGCTVGSMNQTPRLYYYFDQDNVTWCLAYIIEDVARRKRKMTDRLDFDAPLKDYVVDAHSGRLLAALPRTATMAVVQEMVMDALKHKRKITVEAIAGGKKQLHDAVLNVTTYGFDFKDPTAQSGQLPGTLYSKPPGTWPLEAVGAHANGSAVAMFLRNIVKRNNIDNLGGEMISTVNCWDRAEGTTPAKQWRNAYWNGTQMVYGQIQFPDGSFYSIASMLEVVGHEMFHGVTDHTSRLEYRTQSGALNESYSDIFGTIIANFSKPLKKWVWEIGAGFDGPGTALRSLSDPNLHSQPKTMSEYHAATPPYTYDRNDYGWVHDNSGIHNFAAYNIMTTSASGKYLFTPAQLAAMFYIALTVHLSRTSQFVDSRRAVVQATRSLFRNESGSALTQKVRAVERGFSAAGIL
ncbi:M4 family metallopeptidase [Paraburkholderia sp. RL17-347-BIC-D]|uniref:M4 family metallopeptidase n=1 Tax=Paraburkholderia sp. RL17-347-BIC-D TaxID=3031632 RepID=UPI0038BAAFB4